MEDEEAGVFRAAQRRKFVGSQSSSGGGSITSVVIPNSWDPTIQLLVSSSKQRWKMGLQDVLVCFTIYKQLGHFALNPDSVQIVTTYSSDLRPFCKSNAVKRQQN